MHIPINFATFFPTGSVTTNTYFSKTLGEVVPSPTRQMINDEDTPLPPPPGSQTQSLEFLVQHPICGRAPVLQRCVLLLFVNTFSPLHVIQDGALTLKLIIFSPVIGFSIPLYTDDLSHRHSSPEFPRLSNSLVPPFSLIC